MAPSSLDARSTQEDRLVRDGGGDTEERLKAELGPVWKRVAARYFEGVRFPTDVEAELARLHSEGFVVHVMRTTAWVNYLYLTWAMLRRGLPPVRAVVNLRRWFTRPWRKTAQRGNFDVRFTYARRLGGSGLIFLKRSAFGTARGRSSNEDPFPALVALARKSERPVYLVPELFVWEKWNQRLQPGLVDYVFGSPEAPGFLHTLLAFWRNHQRAQFRMGEPIDLRQYVEQNPGDSDERLARKVRGSLYHHLAQETRAVFGPPSKPTSRLLEEAMRDRTLRASLDEIAVQGGKRPEAVYREAARNLRTIAAKPSPLMIALVSPLLSWVFNRIYDGIEIDEVGLERAMKAAGRAPLVLVPSHKSHIDYLVMSYVLSARGYSVPVVAAGANLSFWPLGPFLRRGGAFFLRRSFKGDRVYTAAFKAYVKKLVHDGVPQEFFPEGGRSRTGKLLMPKLGLFTWEVDAVLEGASDDLYFVPASIDYEKVVESSSYSKELKGGEKKPEDLKALLTAPKVLAAKYGRIHLSFDEPFSVAAFAAARGLSIARGIDDAQKKGLVRALSNRVMYGIARVSTITPHALAAAALLAHRRRGVTAREVGERVALLRRVAEEERAPSSRHLRNAPSDPTVFGAIHEAIGSFGSDGMVRTLEAKGELIYQAEEDRRAQLAFYKNTLMNLVASRSLVACAVLHESRSVSRSEVRGRALFLSRLFKFEFIYQGGKSFEALFGETLERLERLGLLLLTPERVELAPEPHSRPQLEFFADLLRDYLEAYLIAFEAFDELSPETRIDRKDLVKAALELGRARFLAGRITMAESLSQTTLDNAIKYLVDQRLLVELDRELALGPQAQEKAQRRALVEGLRGYL